MNDGNKHLQLANQSQIADQALRPIAQIYAVERKVKDLNTEDRLRIWQEKSELTSNYS